MTSRLGTEKTITFFYSVSPSLVFKSSPSTWLLKETVQGSERDCMFANKSSCFRIRFVQRRVAGAGLHIAGGGGAGRVPPPPPAAGSGRGSGRTPGHAPHLRALVRAGPPRLGPAN